MGIMLFVLFAVMEITLAVMTCTRFRDSFSWSRNKAICFSAEFIIMALVFFLATEKWRFVCCFMLFGMRFTCSIFRYIMNLVKREMNTGESFARKETKKGVALFCISSAVLVFCALIPSYNFVQVDGLEQAITEEFSEELTFEIGEIGEIEE